MSASQSDALVFFGAASSPWCDGEMGSDPISPKDHVREDR